MLFSTSMLGRKGFQSLIGRLQTLPGRQSIRARYVFQSLIGRLQTAKRLRHS